MSTASPPASDHPAPQRNAVAPWLLLGGLATGPAAWIAQLVTSYALSSTACTAARAQALPSGPAFHGEVLALLAANLACLTLTAAGGLVSYRNWTSTRREKPGDVHQALSIGEGRTRFIALCGVLSAIGFAVGILFNTLEPLAVQGCWTGI
jgi:hypothetical protein